MVGGWGDGQDAGTYCVGEGNPYKQALLHEIPVVVKELVSILVKIDRCRHSTERVH